ncbi:MAG: stage III sporulation protein AB [Firmicutes bacterium]|nr:stage III sporulation protein AB [Bacillota bacterium]HXL03759.1 stage III sporulation protein AB [Bacillota bacterium]
MLKLLGAVLVVGSSGVIGNIVARSYSERPRQLSELISAFTLLETEISYAKTPLSEALIRAGGQKGSIAGRIFEMASRIIASGNQPPGQAWETAVRRTYSVSALTAEDRDTLLAFSAKLGSCSSTDQLKHIAFVRERLRANETKARDKATETARMWRYLGLTVGAMVTLLLY